MFEPKLQDLLEHAEKELDIAGLKESDDDPVSAKGSTWMRRHILSIVKEFQAAEHSASSAQAAIEILNVLLTLRPLTPLTGEEDEWEDMQGMFSEGLKYRNKRCYRVCKTSDGRTIDTEGRVFWEWVSTYNNDEFKSYYTNKDSWVDITFPYIPVTDYIKKETEENRIASMPFQQFKEAPKE